MGFPVPAALRQYYQVAGRARDFNCAHECLLAPSDWYIQGRKLVFMEGHQQVVVYGTVAGSGIDPPVKMGQEDEPVRCKVNQNCSVFLLVILHWQATFGQAMPHTGVAQIPANSRKLLARDWAYIGEVNRMRAYHKPGRAVCVLKWDGSWCAFAGASTQSLLTEIGNELGLCWNG